jgi:exodeoxyribonuclease VII large subunit
VLARGGGSLEDLAAFNSERVARAIVASALPVVSAVGHETDFTIADFVADLRAPTPSAAAELITEAQHKVEEQVAGLENRLIRAARFQMLRARQRFDRVPVARAEQRVAASLHRHEQRLDDLGFRMENAMNDGLRGNAKLAEELTAALLRHDPRQRWSEAREALASSLSRMHHALERTLSAARHENRYLDDRLYRAASVSVAGRRAAWSNLRGQLQSLSPLAVLERGYALVEDEAGTLVRSVTQIAVGQALRTRLGDGAFSSDVTAIQKNEIQANRTQANSKKVPKKKGKSTST